MKISSPAATRGGKIGLEFLQGLKSRELKLFDLSHASLDDLTCKFAFIWPDSKQKAFFWGCLSKIFRGSYLTLGGCLGVVDYSKGQTIGKPGSLKGDTRAWAVYTGYLVLLHFAFLCFTDILTSTNWSFVATLLEPFSQQHLLTPCLCVTFW